jgi:hypothetical protein
MATAEVESRPQPLFWRHVAQWIRTIPPSALLSMVGPLLLCVVGYLGWRYYGAPKLDRAYYGLKVDNIHITPQPKWLRETNVLTEVFEGSSLSKLSLLDSQTPVVLARVFDAHPSVRKTRRVQRTAGQVMIDLEYRHPVAMVCYQVRDSSKGTDTELYLPIDEDGVLLGTKNFTVDDVPHFVSIYPGSINVSEKLVDGKPIGDSQVNEAVRLCSMLLPIRDQAKISRIYVYKAPQVGKSRWLLEVETQSGPRIKWGSAPGMESSGELPAETKLKQLASAMSDPKLWSQEHLDLSATGRVPIRNSAAANQSSK